MSSLRGLIRVVNLLALGLYVYIVFYGVGLDAWLARNPFPNPKKRVFYEMKKAGFL